ncbi:glycosyltransferase family 2 protein [Geomonas nitrogeniifigens]|uniref:Glycosyltransferase family 2 protein n=1 Tax=Geomonas diazotrophica TaxID=2843197 RepID=A0ABX8JBP4_9BACT|nr:glycosyltransferase family A protein [Geomonas nitrogeniifigens]QWV95839.1 glycosyltransferase family 2 protein [Geomonas nitrogeniifigens]QXE84924.1 glycosyltransferase family 2 protein [Geomonas nitrogeniifigens]
MDISVVIPAYNCEMTIASLLDALKHQETAYRYEVIVVNNASSDQTGAILSSYKSSFPVPLIITHQPRGATIAAVRNSGVRCSSGRLIAFIDSDCLPPSNWLQQGGEYFVEYGEQILVAGGCSPPADGTWVERAWNSVRAGHKNGSFFVHGANFFISRSLFDALGGFRENIETSEDYDLGRRAAQSHRVIAAPEFTVVHYGEANTLYKKFVKERWYAQHMLDTFSSNYLYKPFWISVAFLLNIFVLCASLLYEKFYFAALLIVTILGLPCFLSFYFCKRAKNFEHFMHLIPVCAAYITGRATGMIDSLISEFIVKKH